MQDLLGTAETFVWITLIIWGCQLQSLIQSKNDILNQFY